MSVDVLLWDCGVSHNITLNCNNCTYELILFWKMHNHHKAWKCHINEMKKDEQPLEDYIYTHIFISLIRDK